MNNEDQNNNIEAEELEDKIKEDLSYLYNYPSIGKLFSDTDTPDLQNLRTKLNITKEKLDSIIRRGSLEESQKASAALEAVSLTLDFLEDLEEKNKSL